MTGKANTLIWAPQPGPQKALIDCPLAEVFYGGARGGGKTDGLLGKWALKENNTKYCSTADLPANAPKDTPAPKEACSEFKGPHKAGDKWSQNDSEGKPVTVEIKAGL